MANEDVGSVSLCVEAEGELSGVVATFNVQTSQGFETAAEFEGEFLIFRNDD